MGHLGADAEVKYTAGGVAVANFSLATSRRWKDKQTGEWREETDWHRVVLWRAGEVSRYLTKGRAVLVEGRLQSRSYEDRAGEKRYVTEVVAENVVLLGGGGKEADVKENAAETPADDSGDVPF